MLSRRGGFSVGVIIAEGTQRCRLRIRLVREGRGTSAIMEARTVSTVRHLRPARGLIYDCSIHALTIWGLLVRTSMRTTTRRRLSSSS
jgi:hypothetical protein